MTARGELSAAPEGDVALTGGSARLCLFGASADTGNLGVSALMESTLAGLARRLDRPRITVFDNGLGQRPATLELDPEPLGYALRGARVGRRYWRPESLWNMRVRGWLGGLGNPGVADVDRAHAVLDISGGDSFTDLYGPRRFELVALPKLIALQRRTPLVLLPQTYGPFQSARPRRTAERIVRRAATAWARDPDSYEALQALLGEDFDPARHRCGVDVAFLLEPRRPPEHLAGPLAGWLAAGGGAPVAGLGVSGLVYGDPEAAARFGLAADYAGTVGELARRLLATGARLVLVPHVRGRGQESDDRACAALLDSLDPAVRGRVLVLPGGLDAGGTKWLISQLDWFCGTRMHSTIAALSSGVPAVAIAYSGKTRGVFATCGQAAWVADARTDGTAAVVERVWDSFQARERVAAELGRRAADVRAEASAQMDAIAAACRAAAGAAGGR